MLPLETNRLKFRQWHASDFEDFAEYFSVDDNTRYLGGPRSKESAWRLMASYIGHFYVKGYSYLAIEEKSTENWVGSVGLWNSEPWPEMELGYWILPEYQGKGLAYEAASRVKEYAFKVLRKNTLVSYIDPENIPSIQLAMKLGAYNDGTIELLEFGTHKVYRYPSLSHL